MQKRSNISFLFLILIITCVISCKKKDKDELTDNFDRKGMLENISNNIIIPSYSSLKIKIAALEIAIITFNNVSDSTNLVNTQSLFQEAYQTYQLCSAFEFGPAGQEMFRNSLNPFPADITAINSNVISGSYNLTSDSSPKGFAALDYLLFGTGTNIHSILIKYTTDAYASSRKNYLTALLNNMKGKVNTVYNAWIPTGGNYINTFTTNTKGSIGVLVNQLVLDWDMLRTYKIGIPLGKKTSGAPVPEKVEAYYCQSSVDLALKQCKAIENIFLGKDASGNDGLGLDDYLTYFNAHPQYTSGSLANAIKDQFSLVESKLQLITDPLSTSIVTKTSIVENAYIEIQKTYILLKTDMPSAMGLTIDQDPDGD